MYKTMYTMINSKKLAKRQAAGIKPKLYKTKQPGELLCSGHNNGFDVNSLRPIIPGCVKCEKKLV